MNNKIDQSCLLEEANKVLVDSNVLDIPIPFDFLYKKGKVPISKNNVYINKNPKEPFSVGRSTLISNDSSIESENIFVFNFVLTNDDINLIIKKDFRTIINLKNIALFEFKNNIKRSAYSKFFKGYSYLTAYPSGYEDQPIRKDGDDYILRFFAHIIIEDKEV